MKKYKIILLLQDGFDEGYDINFYYSKQDILKSYCNRYKTIKSLLNHLKKCYSDVLIIYVKEGIIYESKD